MPERLGLVGLGAAAASFAYPAVSRGTGLVGPALRVAVEGGAGDDQHVELAQRERLGRLHGRWRDVLLLERRSPLVT